MRALATLLLIGTVALPATLRAQSPDDPTSDVKIGDRWSYESKNDLTGLPVSSYTAIVTEISPQEVVTAIASPGRPNASSLVIFDHQWNRLEYGGWKYKPSDGQGIQWPLEVGKEWRIEYVGRNTQGAGAVKVTNRSKVTAKETITTPGGTFDTFKIERHLLQVNAADPTKGSETDVVMWYAPEIHHWVRRTFVTKVEHRTRNSQTEELTDYARKE